jgi:hypothetical protein
MEISVCPFDISYREFHGSKLGSIKFSQLDFSQTFSRSISKVPFLVTSKHEDNNRSIPEKISGVKIKSGIGGAGMLFVG